MLNSLSLFTLFLIIGAALLAIKSTRRLNDYRKSQDWPKYSATITKAFVRERADSDGTAHLPEFSFRYVVAGIEYISSMHTDGVPFPGTEQDIHKLVKRFPIGSTVKVAVNPTDPSFAILDTGYPQAWRVLRIASLAAVFAGVAIILTKFFLSTQA